MKILVTGHNGYIGSVMVPMIVASGHEVTGLDAGLFEDCIFGEKPTRIPEVRKDIRDVSAADLNGFDAIIHLAALSNDPLGDLNPQCTYDINHLASVKLASVAKRAGVPRFLFTSSCSLYGVAGGEDMLREDAAFNPITPYGESKVRAERDIEKLADKTFSPVFLRCATAYGVSPRLRADVVVNNLVGVAFTTGEVLIKSDGTPWRPLVHIEDITRAFLAVLHAPRELIHNQAFNVGASKENYQIRDVADIVRQVVPGSKIQYAEGAGPDPRCYRVDCSKLATVLPEFQPKWTVRLGAEQLYAAFKKNGTNSEEFLGDRYTRLKHLRTLMKSGQLDEALRWRIATPA
jgi:nucleoside-diphosphate-sugar epimerase